MAEDKGNKEKSKKEEKKVVEPTTTSIPKEKKASDKKTTSSKYVGIVVRTFRKKGKKYLKGTSYDAIGKDSYDYLIKSGYIKPKK